MKLGQEMLHSPATTGYTEEVTVSWAFDGKTGTGMTFSPLMRQEDAHLTSLALTATLPLFGGGALHASAAIDHCLPPSRERGHAYWCMGCGWIDCHILTDEGHSGDRHNLMWNAAADSKHAKQPKRLNANQVEIIKRSSYIR